MKFSEIPLYQAIVKVYAAVERPRGREWLIHNHRELYKFIVDQMTDFSNGVPWKLTEVLEAWEGYGKGAKVNDLDETKTDIIVRLASGSAAKCFYSDRGLGECAEEIDLDRIVPGSRGGAYTLENCLLSCSKHNRERGDKPIEDFIGRKSN